MSVAVKLKQSRNFLDLYSVRKNFTMMSRNDFKRHVFKGNFHVWFFFSNLGFNLNIIFNSFYHSFDLNDFLHWLFLKISILLTTSRRYLSHAFRDGADFSFSVHYSLFMTKVYNDYKFPCNNFLIWLHAIR